MLEFLIVAPDACKSCHKDRDCFLPSFTRVGNVEMTFGLGTEENPSPVSVAGYNLSYLTKFCQFCTVFEMIRIADYLFSLFLKEILIGNLSVDRCLC